MTHLHTAIVLALFPGLQPSEPPAAVPIGDLPQEAPGKAPETEQPVKTLADLSEAEAKEFKIVAAVDDARAAAFVRELVALGPRMGGTESGRKAAERLEKEFAGLGLATTRSMGPARWCHEETDWNVTVHLGDEEPYVIERAWPLGFSPAGEGEGVSLSLEPTAGRGLLAKRFRSTPRGEEPCAVVLCDGANTLDGEWPICRPHGRREKARVAVFGIPDRDGAKIRGALAAGVPVTLDWSLETTIREAPAITVVAELESATPDAPDAVAVPHLLICAHGDSDSGGPGANDNASGVAIVLEIARAWTQAIESGQLSPPPMEVRFAIWGTEITSTSAYRDSDYGRGVACVMNFDQAGFGSTGERMHVEPDDLEGNHPFVKIAGDVLSTFAGLEGFPKRWATNKSLGGTDSYVFSGWKRFRDEKLPSVTMFTSAWGKPDQQPRTEGQPGASWRKSDVVEMDYDVHYHSVGDTPENTTDKEPHNMGWCARVGLLTSLRYLQSLGGK